MPEWRVLALGAAMLLAVGCSSEPELVFDENDPPEELAFIENEPEIADADRDLALFEADWVCELERRSFASLPERDEALDDALVATGLGRESYDGFRARLGEEQELRDAVLFHYQQSCLS